MSKPSKYQARKPDEKGVIQYSSEENVVWEILIKRQLKLVQGRACDEFIKGLDTLNLPLDHIPQLVEVDKTLYEATGWKTEPVAALINFDTFFSLLANKKFPVATFIRSREELDYLEEPDIFHEIFGHCPLLTHPDFAKFTENYGKIASNASPSERAYLARLYWFSIEFGLLNTEKGMRVYGGGILSSKEEILYSLESDVPLRIDFNPMDVLRMPYRIDVLQAVYFKINQMNELSAIADLDLLAMVKNAKNIGLYPSLYPSDDRAA